jgi:branched-chain amino acid transport system substrate-binding protein
MKPKRRIRTPLTNRPLNAADRARYPYEDPEHGPLTEEDASRLGQDTPMNRREFLRVAGKLGLSAFATSTLYPTFLAACGRTLEQSSTEGFGEDAVTGETINIGVISIYSGVGAFVGQLVQHGAELAVEQINKHGVSIPTESPGSLFPSFEKYQTQTDGGILGGKKIALIQRDDNLSAQVAVQALTEMVTKFDIKGVIFAGLLDDIFACKKAVQQYNLPAIACYSDLYSTNSLFPESDYRQVFQIFPPDIWATQVLADYAIDDRGYSQFAFIGDNTAIGNQGRRMVEQALGQRGAGLATAEQYNVGDTDMTAQMLRIKGTGCNALFLWGLAGDTAHGLQNIEAIGGGYTDRDAALSSWRPQILGFPGGAAERTFAELAGPAAKSGTVSTWYVGGVGYLPQFQGAVNVFRDRWGQTPTGGENNPADSCFLLAKAFNEAQSTDPAKVIETLERTSINFVSVTPHAFAPDRHISLTIEDIVGVTLERGRAVPTSPSYELGTEYQVFHPPGYIGPTHFVRPNLEGNVKKYPELMKIFYEEGYGTQCTKVPDKSVPWGFRLTNECKIH